MVWHLITNASTLKSGEYKAYQVKQLNFLLINIDDQFYAIENQCSHQAAPLDGGEIEGNEFICPLHGARFCIKTGEATLPPAYEPIAKFDTKVENGKVWVSLFF